LILSWLPGRKQAWQLEVSQRSSWHWLLAAHGAGNKFEGGKKNRWKKHEKNKKQTTPRSILSKQRIEEKELSSYPIEPK